jgi:hypothetical protein
VLAGELSAHRAAVLAVYHKEMTPLNKLAQLKAIADRHFDGHVTIMKFTTNWRVGFGTPTWRCDIDRMWEGKTFNEAATAAIAGHEQGEWRSPDCQTHEMQQELSVSVCGYCGEAIE